MQLFSEDPTIFSKKTLNLFFAHENIKKRASKVGHNRPQIFFHSTGPAAQTSPELIFHILKMSHKTYLSPYSCVTDSLVLPCQSGWLFRLF